MNAIVAPYHLPQQQQQPLKQASLDSGDDRNKVDRQVSFNESVTIQSPPAPPRTALDPMKSQATAIGGHTDPNTNTNADVTYRERIGGYLHPRDMRRLVTPFSASNEPELIVRRHVMLLNFDPLRAVILRDRLLILVPHGADSLLTKLENRVRGGAVGVENSVFGTASEVDNDPDEPSSHKSSERSSDNNNSNINALSQGIGKIMPTLFTKTSDVSSSAHDKSNPAPVKPLGIGGVVLKRGNSNDLDVAEIVSKITQSMEHGITVSTKAKSETTDDTDNGDDGDSVNSEWVEMNTRNWIDLPFELQCADAVLNVVCSILSEDAYDLQECALSYIDTVVTGKFRIGDDPMTGLRHTKDAIREMCSRIKGFVQSMNRILDDDEDMALMNLSRLLTHPERYIKPVPLEILEEESDEPELILEAHLQIGLTLMNALDLIQGQVDSASDLVDQKLDSVRNRILFANMIISIFSLCMTAAAVVGSFFGMNVPVPFRDSETEEAFTIISLVTVFGAFATAGLILAALFYTQAIPLPGMSG